MKNYNFKITDGLIKVKADSEKEATDKIGNIFDLMMGELKSFVKIEEIKFKLEKNKFFYEEASLEIFGHADEMCSNITTKLNMFYLGIKEDEEHDVVLISREGNNSIPATYFFLSKTGNKIPTIKFSSKYVFISLR